MGTIVTVLGKKKIYTILNDSKYKQNIPSFHGKDLCEDRVVEATIR